MLVTLAVALVVVRVDLVDVLVVSGGVVVLMVVALAVMLMLVGGLGS
jgi:hypothetical protein